MPQPNRPRRGPRDRIGDHSRNTDLKSRARVGTEFASEHSGIVSEVVRRIMPLNLAGGMGYSHYEREIEIGQRG